MKAEGGGSEGVDIQCQPVPWQEDRMREFNDTIDGFIVIAQQNLFGTAPAEPIIGPSLDEYICAAYAKVWGVNLRLNLWILSAQLSREDAAILTRQYHRKGMRVSNLILSSSGSTPFEAFTSILEAKFHAEIMAIVRAPEACELSFERSVSPVNPDVGCQVSEFSLRALKSMIADSRAKWLDGCTAPSVSSAVLTRL